MLSESQRAALSARLRRGRDEPVAQIPRRPEGLTDLPLSFEQEQLWFINRFTPGEAIYNIPFAVRLCGPLDARALGRGVTGLAARHEPLRTRLVTRADGPPTQMIDPPAPVAVERIELSRLEPDKQLAELREFISAEVGKPFSLADGPLLRGWLSQ